MCFLRVKLIDMTLLRFSVVLLKYKLDCAIIFSISVADLAKTVKIEQF